MQPKLLLATNNQGKVREYRCLLSGIPFELVTLAEAGVNALPDEAGASLEENARLKAKESAAASGLLSLADDSGLEVDALGGEPGHRSARYAGEGASDRDRVAYLLQRLKGVPLKKRSARFRCVIAVAQPGGGVELCCGECRGVIALAPRGEGGFGYDPLFYLPGLGKTMAELSPALKNRVSHRGKAARRCRKVLEGLAAKGAGGTRLG